MCPFPLEVIRRVCKGHLSRGLAVVPCTGPESWATKLRFIGQRTTRPGPSRSLVPGTDTGYKPVASTQESVDQADPHPFGERHVSTWGIHGSGTSCLGREDLLDLPGAYMGRAPHVFKSGIAPRPARYIVYPITVGQALLREVAIVGLISQLRHGR